MKHFKYPSIEQLRHTTKSIIHTATAGFLPSTKLTFTGTVKVHGTNSGVVITPTEVYATSRNQVLAEGNDSYGFYTFVNNNKQFFRDYIDSNFSFIDKTFVIYGEWAGKGIQSKVGTTCLDKFYYVFNVGYINNNDAVVWVSDYPEISNQSLRIFDKRMFYVKKLEIDFNNISNEVLDQLTNETTQVEKTCPVASLISQFDNVTLTSTIGEGVVWEFIDDHGRLFNFKIKGEKHQVAKQSNIVQIDPDELKSINEFILYALSEQRLLQFLPSELEMENLGQFIKAVSLDILKEEKDVIEQNNLEWKLINKYLTRSIKLWYIGKMNESI